MPWDFAAILLLLGVLVPWRGAVRIRQLLSAPQTSSAERLAIYASTIAFQWAVAGVIAWRSVERGLHPGELGLRALASPAAWIATLLLLALFCANQIASLRRMAAQPREQQGIVGHLARKLLPQNLVEALAFLALAVTVGICEEFIYRGFVYVVFERIGGGVAAVAVSSVMFSLAHVYQGRRGMASTLFVGAIFGVVRAATGSLLPVMLMHTVIDLVAGLAGPRMLRGPVNENIQ